MWLSSFPERLFCDQLALYKSTKHFWTIWRQWSIASTGGGQAAKRAARLARRRGSRTADASSSAGLPCHAVRVATPGGGSNT